MDNDEHDIAPARIRSTGTTMPQVSPQVAAILLALPGMVLFGVYHWFWVAPVAAVFLEGIIWVLLFGTVVGWAYQRTMLDVGRTGIAWGLRFGALMAATLVPGFIVGIIHGPFPATTDAGVLLRVLPLAFLGVPASIFIAWMLTSRQRIAWPFVVACLPTGIMIGGSVANFGGALDLFLLFVVLLVLGGGALAWVVGWKAAAQ